MTLLKCNVWQWRRTVVYVLLHDSASISACVTYIACITQVTLEVIKYTPYRYPFLYWEILRHVKSFLLNSQQSHVTSY